MQRANLAESILADLNAVQNLRDDRGRDRPIALTVQAVKEFQARRLERTYADLLRDPRQGPATRFFLEDLYGPGDFSRRDQQFARIVPAMKRLLPAEVLSVIARVTALHLLSEQLDGDLARTIGSLPISALAYRRAWRGLHADEHRQRQLAEVLEVGQALDGLTRQALLRQTIKWMRQPAQVAGLGELHSFLERGFGSFVALNGAKDFLDIIQAREGRLLAALANDPSGGSDSVTSDPQALGWLPPDQ